MLHTFMGTNPFTILIVGGYGFFGRRIARWLVSDRNIRLLIGGRDALCCDAMAKKLRAEFPDCHVDAYTCDIHAADAPLQLKVSTAQAVINTAGPFQTQDYRVVRACIDAGLHYLDLSDGRSYVSGISVVDEPARERGVAVLSGASTAPAVSTAVVDSLAADLSDVRAVEIGISVGNRTERGLATVQAVLSYCGQAFPMLTDDIQRTAFGWQALVRHRYPAPVGPRWLAACDVPDLELLPERYRRLRSVVFRAGLELPLFQFSLWGMSWLARWKWVGNLSAHAVTLSKLADLFRNFGSDVGAMHVTLTGVRNKGHKVRRTWTLVAREGLGPQVPCTVAVILARRWAAGERPPAGAAPCIGIVSRAEIENAWKELPFETKVDEVSL